jgi:hypothetical protein
MLNTGITNEKADKGENDEWSHLLVFNHEMVTMTAKKGKFEFDDKMKDGVKKAGHELKEDISELGGKTKKKPKE